MTRRPRKSIKERALEADHASRRATARLSDAEERQFVAALDYDKRPTCAGWERLKTAMERRMKAHERAQAALDKFNDLVEKSYACGEQYRV